MNFRELIDLTNNTIDETDYDEQIESIIKNAINKAYIDLSSVDLRVTMSYLPIINSIATIPTNCCKITKTTPKLDNNDKIIGNSIITDKTGIIEMLYAYIREPMLEDTDEPDLNTILQYALVTYACYKYFEHRKKIDVANSFLNNYMQEVQNFNSDLDNTPETIMEV